MTIQLSTAVRNARVSAIEGAIGPSPILKIFTGLPPANTDAAETGTTLATVQLPADWMGDAAGGAVSMLGNWEDQSADATGTAGHFRFYDSTGTVCHLQGTVTLEGGGGDMTVLPINFYAGQDFKVTGFSLADANA